MIRTYLLAGLIFAAAETLGGQSDPKSTAPTPPAGAKPITLVGCVQTDAAKPEWFTLSDKTTGASYRLTGTNVRSYVWRNVRIVGGLVPSPNIAAQAGAIDATKTAMAYQGANSAGSGSGQLLEFNVKSVRRLTGSCTPKAGP